MIEQADGDVVPVPTDDLRELILELDGLTEAGDLGRFIGRIQPLGKDLASSASAGVRIMSMASAKGLTVEATIVAAGENEVIPRPGADVHEERRLLYVALTRARKVVYATSAPRRTGPSARAGGGRPVTRRSYSDLLQGGPVPSQDGRCLHRFPLVSAHRATVSKAADAVSRGLVQGIVANGTK